jgi:hypothetical protein
LEEEEGQRRTKKKQKGVSLETADLFTSDHFNANTIANTTSELVSNNMTVTREKGTTTRDKRKRTTVIGDKSDLGSLAEAMNSADATIDGILDSKSESIK